MPQRVCQTDLTPKSASYNDGGSPAPSVDAVCHCYNRVMRLGSLACHSELWHTRQGSLRGTQIRSTTNKCHWSVRLAPVTSGDMHLRRQVLQHLCINIRITIAVTTRLERLTSIGILTGPSITSNFVKMPAGCKLSTDRNRPSSTTVVNAHTAGGALATVFYPLVYHAAPSAFGGCAHLVYDCPDAPSPGRRGDTHVNSHPLSAPRVDCRNGRPSSLQLRPRWPLGPNMARRAWTGSHPTTAAGCTAGCLRQGATLKVYNIPIAR